MEPELLWLFWTALILPFSTKMSQVKTTTQREGCISFPKGVFETITDKEYKGYEIHMGQSGVSDVVISNGANVYASYVHGIFDEDGIAADILKILGKKSISLLSYSEFKESQYDILADTIRANIDMDKIYGILREANIKD